VIFIINVELFIFPTKKQMKNIKLLLSYDGTGLLGWQKTPLGPTVEQHLENALSKILQEKIKLQAASRTDAGVHAEGQVINFFTEKQKIDLEKLQKSINALLPPQIAALLIEEMPQDFHPTLNNRGKEYRYFLCNESFQKPKHRLFSWHFPYPLDLEKMEAAALYLVGTHDFSTFCNELPLSKKNPICTLNSLKIEQIEENRFCFKVEGDRFLFRMVRNLVGTLAYAGAEKLELSEISSLLETRKRKFAGVTAPAHGLHLMKVFY